MSFLGSVCIRDNRDLRFLGGKWLIRLRIKNGLGLFTLFVRRGWSAPSRRADVFGDYCRVFAIGDVGLRK